MDWKIAIFGFLWLISLWFIGKKLDGFLFYLGIIILPLLCIDINRLLSKGETSIRDEIVISLYTVGLIILTKVFLNHHFHYNVLSYQYSFS